MNYEIKQVNFEISNFTTISKKIINSNLLIRSNDSYSSYKIINYIGKGTVGQVYLLESQKDLSECVIKISNLECVEDLFNEVKFIQNTFTKYNIEHPSFPLFCGYFTNLKAFGVIYPYFGFFNLEKIKTIDYTIDFINNKKIILQIINQLISLKNIIHSDLKSSNVVVDVINNNIFATIVDFGLAQDCTLASNVISTHYITSPESLLSTPYFSECLLDKEDLKLDKSDYIGLFSIVLNLFIRKSFWSLFFRYLTDIGFNSEFLHKQKASFIFVYTWFKFCYKDKSQIINKSLHNIINTIELMYPSILSKIFLDYDDFFENYICQYIDLDTIDKKKLDDLKDFTEQIVQFDSTARPELSELLNHKFLN